jgi:hypothetical protein
VLYLYLSLIKLITCLFRQSIISPGILVIEIIIVCNPSKTVLISVGQKRCVLISVHRVRVHSSYSYLCCRLVGNKGMHN